jgi:DNA repair protein RecO (recombination protein O)
VPAAPAQETLELMSALQLGHWEIAERSTGNARREGSGLIAALLQWHLERQLRSLPLVERKGVQASGSDVRSARSAQ